MSEKSYYLGFSVFPGIGPGKFTHLLSLFGTARAIWDAPLSDLKEAKLGEILAEKFALFRSEFSLQEYEEKLVKKHVWYVTPQEVDYPRLLREIKHPPFVLYGRGDKLLLNSSVRTGTLYVGIVGTRKVTGYGRQVTEMFTKELVQSGCVIVSGLALGVDAIAHQVVIEEKGKTVAVLGCGVDVCYPSSNEHLYDAILENGGTIVSEYPLGMAPSVGSFPSRNRIIAGLSSAVLVTEGAEDSGALITADHAFSLQRSVFAIPGAITSQLSKGPHKVIAQGGKLVIDPKDILKDLGVTKMQSAKVAREIKGDTKEEQQLIDVLVNENLSLDELVRITKKNVSQVSMLLSTLELKGIVKDMQGTYTLDRN